MQKTEVGKAREHFANLATKLDSFPGQYARDRGGEGLGAFKIYLVDRGEDPKLKE